MGSTENFFRIIVNSSLINNPFLQARPSADSPINYEEGLKKSAEYLADLTKKLEESTGIHSEFDKEKYIKAGKALLEKLQEAQSKLKEAYESNVSTLSPSLRNR